MKSRISLLAFALAAASTAALADEASTPKLAYTDLAPYTDVGSPAVRGSAAAQRIWKGNLSRADVIAAMREARANGTIAVGDAVGYPYPLKAAPATAEAAPAAAPPDRKVMGASPADADVTLDGYRFVGGEAGYIFVGRPKASR